MWHRVTLSCNAFTIATFSSQYYSHYDSTINTLWLWCLPAQTLYAWVLKLSRVTYGYNASLSDHGILEDHIPSLKSHGPWYKTVVSWCPANLLLFITRSPEGMSVRFAAGPFTIRYLISDLAEWPPLKALSDIGPEDCNRRRNKLEKLTDFQS